MKAHRLITAMLALLPFATVHAAGTISSLYNYDYAITFPNSNSASFQISDWYIFEGSDEGGYGLRQSTDVISSPDGGTLKAYYPLPAPAPDALLIGVTQNLPGDAPGQQHIVLGMATDAAALAQGIDWGTLFPNTDEDTLIYSLENDENPDPNVTGAALQYIDNFVYGDATSGILDESAQPHTAWFNPDGGAFTIETFSTGNVVGQGIATQYQVPQTPGPASMTAFIGLAASIVRRKKRR